MTETGRSSGGWQAGHLARFSSLLRLLGGNAPRGEMLRDLLTHLRQWSGCEAVGIRLREGDDYPYHETCGFPEEFLRLENSLCPGSSGRFTTQGEPELECMCGNVIQGRTDPAQPFFTPFGSFWSNGTTALLAGTTEAQRQGRTRNRCNSMGYESVALVPLRFGGVCHGLLQFNDRSPGRFTPEGLEFLECLAENVALWLSRQEAEAARRETDERAEAMFETGNALRLLVDPDSGRILHANSLAVEFYGYPLDVLTTMRITQINMSPPGEVRQRMASLVSGTATGPFYFQHRLADGSLREVEVHSRPMWYRGRRVLFSLVIDITERRRAEEHTQGLARFPGENPNPVLRVDAELRVTYANKPAQRLLRLGHCADDKSFAESVGVEAERALRTGKLRRFEAYLGRRTFAFTAKPLVHSGYANLYGADITALRRAMAALGRSEERQRLLVENAPDPIFVQVEGCFAFANPATASLLGESRPEALIGQSVVERIHPEDRELVRERIRRLNQQREAVPRQEVRFLRADGGVVHAETSAVPIDFDGRQGALVFVRDTTDRRKAEESLRQREALLGAMIQSLPFDFWARDRDMRVIMQSRECARVWGELMGKPFQDSDIPPETLERWRRDNERALAGEVLESEYFQQLPDGAQRFVRAVLAPVVLSGGSSPEDVIGIMGVNVDLTDRVRAEEALREARTQAEAANQAKSAFLANMSHEIRTPLNGLMGMMQLLETSELSEEQLEFTRMALRAGGRLTSLLSDILDLSRIEAGRMPLVMGEFAVADLLTSVRETFGPMSAEKGLALVLEADPATPERLVGDELRVRQILLNLVGNAMKFSDKGEVRLHIRPLVRARGMGARLLFQVSDQGIGIDEGQMQEIFEPFAQGRGGLERGHQGVGLGLAITKRLVDAMEGTLAYESEVGVGTTACVMLPFALPRGRARGREEGCLLPGREESGLSILLAEDDAVSQLGTRCLLERLGHTVAVAGTGAQALELLAAQRFDLVLMDVQMPEMDGVEAVRRIRAHDRGLFDPEVPVVALTAYAMAGDRERLLEAGMSGYLSKPFELGELRQAIERAARPGDSG